MPSRMHLETHQIADRVASMLEQPLPDIPPRPDHVYTLARGSSDHAASVVQRLLASAAIAATSMPPSLLAAPLALPGSAVIAISQSGASPDLCAGAAYARKACVPVIAVVNAPGSALEQVASCHVPQRAGEELAVAATKSVVCSIVAGARIAQAWGAQPLPLQQLPDRIQREQQRNVDRLVSLFVEPGPLLVIGRGAGLGVAAEIALKVQELLGRPAMAYSSAEVLHGPAGMISSGYPVLALTLGPEAAAVQGSAEQLERLGARVVPLDVLQGGDVLDATVALTRVYVALEAACRALDRSPDKPDNLSKVTLTQ